MQYEVEKIRPNELIRIHNRKRREIREKKHNMMSRVKKIKIDLPLIPINELEALVIERYNNIQKIMKESGFTYKPFVDHYSKREFLDTLMVNYLRHELTSYDKKMFSMFGETGKAEACMLLNKKIYKAISALYPELEEAVKRQFKEKLERNRNSLIAEALESLKL